MKKRIKTREELAHELGISRRTFYSKLKEKAIQLPAGTISPKDQEMIYKAFGFK